MARACGLALLLTACHAPDGSDPDVGPAVCDATPHVGCPCDGSVPMICGPVSDLVCAAGVWVVAADVCGELDVGVHDAGATCEEGTFACGGVTPAVCCNGHFIDVDDPMLCLVTSADSGLGPNSPVCTSTRTDPGCGCDGDAGAMHCVASTIGACVGGIWQRTDHACGLCPR